MRSSLLSWIIGRGWGKDSHKKCESPKHSPSSKHRKVEQVEEQQEPALAAPHCAGPKVALPHQMVKEEHTETATVAKIEEDSAPAAVAFSPKPLANLKVEEEDAESFGSFLMRGQLNMWNTYTKKNKENDDDDSYISIGELSIDSLQFADSD